MCHRDGGGPRARGRTTLIGCGLQGRCRVGGVEIGRDTPRRRLRPNTYGFRNGSCSNCFVGRHDYVVVIKPYSFGKLCTRVIVIGETNLHDRMGFIDIRLFIGVYASEGNPCQNDGREARYISLQGARHWLVCSLQS
jgi:hypothetical protein